MMGGTVDWKPPVLGSLVSLSPLTGPVSWARCKVPGAHFSLHKWEC